MVSKLHLLCTVNFILMVVSSGKWFLLKVHLCHCICNQESQFVGLQQILCEISAKNDFANNRQHKKIIQIPITTVRKSCIFTSVDYIYLCTKHLAYDGLLYHQPG